MVVVAVEEGLLYIDDEFVALLHYFFYYCCCWRLVVVADAAAVDVMQPKRIQWKKPMMMHETPMTNQSGSSHVWEVQQ